jgi:hypothetical protein
VRRSRGLTPSCGEVEVHASLEVEEGGCFGETAVLNDGRT